MPPRLRNPLRGSRHPRELAGRITNFLLLGLLTLYLGTNRRVFRRIVARQVGTTDLRALPPTPRRIAHALCGIGTFFIFLAIFYLFASSWNTLWAATAAVACFGASSLTLSTAIWGAAPSLLGRGRLADILRRTWEVIRRGVP